MHLRHLSGTRHVVIALVAALSLTAAACGSDDESSSSTTGVATTESVATTEPADTSAPTDTTPGDTTPATVESTTVASSTDGSAAAPGATRTVVHELGTSEVPVDPQRIVVVDRRGTLAFLLELGIEPVGALGEPSLFGGPFHPLITDAAEAAGVEAIDNTDGPNLEQIASLEPDLIIGNIRDMAETETELAGIAPTIGLRWDFADPLANAVEIGEALDLGAEAQALVDEFDAALADAAGSVPDPGTVSIIGLFAADDLRIYREGNLYARLTMELGGEVLPSAAELPLDPEDNEVNFVSMEQIGLASGDRLIALINVAPDADAAYRAVESAPLVQALPGFQNGKVLEADPQLAFGAAGVTGIRSMLDQLVEFYNS